ncbi:MAG: hypothetical protein IID28_10495 [Planctomycetes bacterium]|nr:hypothetical protein [Planctomycetota bacterium]
MILHRSTLSCGHGLWVRLLAAGLLALLVLARSAAAQGTTGTLADPMSTAQLMQYADRLQLDAGQRLAIESIHDEYKSEFRRLRDNEIDDFLKSMHSMQSVGMMPDRARVEAFFKKMQRLQGRIKTLDDRLFDQLLPILNEEQLPMLSRVRLARQRQRYTSQQMMPMTGRRPVDLSEVFLETDLPADVLVDADHVIAAYERHLTTAMRRASDAAGRFNLDMLDAFEEMGYGEITQEDLSDPEVMKQMMADMKQVWAEIGTKMKEAATAITELNRRTLRRVAAFLPPDSAREFRNNYYRAAYPELVGMLAMERQEWFAWATEHEDVSDEQREQLAAALALHRQKLDRLVDDAVELIEARRENSSPMDFDMEAMQEHQQQLMKIHSAAQKLRSTTMIAVKEIVPRITPTDPVEDAQQKALALAGVDDLFEADTGQDSDTADADEKTGDHVQPPVRRIDKWIPNPISERDIARYAEELALDDEALAWVHDLHAGYAQQFDSIEALRELQAAGRSLWRYDPATGTTEPPATDAFERVHQLRLKAIERIILVDRSFFDDVQALTPDEHVRTLARLRTRRLRQIYTVNAPMYRFGLDQSAEGSIDLVEIVQAGTLDEDDLQLIDSILATYEEPATDLFRTRFEAQLSYQRTMQMWSAEARAHQGDPDAGMESAMRYREIVGEASKKVDDAGRNVAQLNRRTIEELVDTLSDAAGTSIRLAYERKAYPSIYKDPVSIERPLRAAFKLKDLTGQQREQLDELAASYEPEYQRLSAAMVKHVGRNQVNPMNFEVGDWQDYQKKQEQLQRLRFDRDELCYRAISRLKVILDPGQIKRIGGLPAPRTPRPGGVIISR